MSVSVYQCKSTTTSVILSVEEQNCQFVKAAKLRLIIGGNISNSYIRSDFSTRNYLSYSCKKNPAEAETQKPQENVKVS